MTTGASGAMNNIDLLGVDGVRSHPTAFHILPSRAAEE